MEGDTNVRLRRKNIVPANTRAVCLPRRRNIFPMSGRQADVPSLDELEHMMLATESNDTGQTGVAQLRHVFHVLRVRHENGAGVIDVALFNLFAVGFELPADLAIRWPAADIRDFTNENTLKERPEGWSSRQPTAQDAGEHQ